MSSLCTFDQLMAGPWGEIAPHYAGLRDEWLVVARSKDVGENEVKKITLLGEDLVLWRSGGEIHCWKDLCIHRGARLSLGWVKEGNIVCPYHGWAFDGSAKCVKIPAHPDQIPPLKARAFPHPVKEAYGFIWASIGEPAQDVPPFPQWDDASFRKVHAGPYFYAGDAMRTVENFLDVAHFPYVHAGLNGYPGAPDPIHDYEVFERDGALCTSPIRVHQPYGDHRGIPVTSEYNFNCFRLLTAHFVKHTGPTERFATYFNVTPVGPRESIVWLIVAINFGEDLTEEKILERQDRVFEQDRLIVESQRPDALPTELTEELHVRCDKYAIEYRKWVKRAAEQNRGTPQPKIKLRSV